MGNYFDITELLKTKSFSELTTHELKFVLSEVENEAEYEMLRKIILESRDEIERASSSKDAVMAAFDKEFPPPQNSESSKRLGFWPYFAAAASIIVVLVVGSLFMDSDREQIAENSSVEKEKKEKGDEANELREEPKVSQEIKGEATKTTSDEDALTEQELEELPIEEELTETEAQEDLVEIDSRDADIEIEKPELTRSMPTEEHGDGEGQFTESSADDFANVAQSVRVEESNTESERIKNASRSEVEYEDLEKSSEESVSAIAYSATTQSRQRSSKQRKKSKTSISFEIKRINKGHFTSY